jgi:hypothetical protein
VTGAEAAAHLRALAMAVEGIPCVTLVVELRAGIATELAPVVDSTPAARPASSGAARAKAYRERQRTRERVASGVTERDAEAHASRDGERDEQRDASRSAPLPTPLPFSSGGSDSIEKTTTTSESETRASFTPSRDDERDASRVTRAPRNLTEAVALPLLERAQLCHRATVKGDAFTAEAMCPHKWDEIQDLAAAFREATGLDHVLAGPWPNPTTKRLVELLATPHLPGTIKQGFKALRTSSWWSKPERQRLGLAGISARVLEGLLTEASGTRQGGLSTDAIERLFDEPTEAAANA